MTRFALYRIDSGFIIKVADFGLSESLDITKDYFRQNLQDANIRLPVKWLAPECISDGKFSEKSDVVNNSGILLHSAIHYHFVFLCQWAYGVTCWEIYSSGKTPYPGVHPMEIAQRLEEGYRMKKAENAACTDDM